MASHWCGGRLVGIFLVVLIKQLTASTLTLKNNGYENLVVAIHNDLPVDIKYIREIQTMFTAASSYLYRATRNRAYFRDITILIPKSWPQDPNFLPANGQTFESADVRIDRPHPAFGDNPYTFQPEACGRPGKYIHLTRNFALDLMNREGNFGPTGRLLVHEFAHYRYGVFDEYGIPGSKKYPVFYLDGTRFLPTGCTKEVKGHAVDPKGYLCSINPTTKLPNEHCYFIGDASLTKAKASIMFYQHLDTVDSFCESNPSDPRLLHNSDAPNQHNDKCGGRGTWDVIKEHPDFYSTNFPVTINDTRPKFRVVQDRGSQSQTCHKRVVILLDLSGSMLTNDRWHKQSQTASKFIRDIVPLGTEVGVVTFSTTARTRNGMKILTTEADKKYLANNLPVKSDIGGGTAIGLGLREALRLLGENAKEVKGSHIFLITDGEENEHPYVREMMGEVISAGVIVDTIAYSSAAAKALKDLSERTNGMYTYYSEGESTALDSAISRLWKDFADCQKTEQIEVQRKRVQLSNGKYDGRVIIDLNIGNNTVFVFTPPNGVHIEVQLFNPSRSKTYNKNSPQYDYDSLFNIIRFHIKDAEFGTWTFSITSRASASVVLTVKSEPRTGKNAIAVDTWMESMGSIATKSAVIYCYVHAGYAPVMYADVTATIERPDGSHVTVKLHDDGDNFDIQENDGVYTGSFSDYNANARYQIDTAVLNIDDKTVIPQSAVRPGAAPVFWNNTVPTTFMKTGNFSRTSSAGAMDVSGYQSSVDLIAPGKIDDLAVISQDREQNFVTLAWTSPGDDDYSGTVSSYELRMSAHTRDLRTRFEKCLLVSNTIIVSGDLRPQKSGTQHRITLHLPPTWSGDAYVFGIKAFDETGQASPLSNLKTVTCKPETDNTVLIACIIAAVCGTLLLVFGGFFIIVRFVRPRRLVKEKCDSQTSKECKA